MSQHTVKDSPASRSSDASDLSISSTLTQFADCGQCGGIVEAKMCVHLRSDSEFDMRSHHQPASEENSSIISYSGITADDLDDLLERFEEVEQVEWIPSSGTSSILAAAVSSSTSASHDIHEILPSVPSLEIENVHLAPGCHLPSHNSNSLAAADEHEAEVCLTNQPSVETFPLEFKECYGEGISSKNMSADVEYVECRSLTAKEDRNDEDSNIGENNSENVIPPTVSHQNNSVCSDHDSSSRDTEPDFYDFHDDREHMMPKRKSRKRHSDQPVVADTELLFDKLPNYYTALSIPARAIAGSTARSSSNLVSDFAHHERDPSPDRATDPVFDKLPAYHSSFTNSMRYDNEMPISFGTNFDDWRLDEYSYESRFGRSNDQSEMATYVTPSEMPNADISSQKYEQAQRCIVYVGRIPRNFTSKQLRTIFEQFGEIQNCSVHFREHGDNYGFVTFVQPVDACVAVERGKTVKGCETFDICFGGRRQFCKADYSDLDGNNVVEEELKPFTTQSKTQGALDFDQLLNIAKQRLVRQ